MNKIILTICFICSLAGALVYKLAVHQEPWAIGMSQVFALSIIFGFIYLALLHYDRTKAIISQYFRGSDSPINIAIFRMIFFWWLFRGFQSPERIWYSHFPKELQFPPMGMGWLLPHLPINEPLVIAVCFLFKLFCFLSIIGLFTRVSTVMAALTGFYVIGIPQFYGSVAHNHHIFWILVIFAASRCSDILSVDAVIKGFKRADQGDVSVPKPSNTYALPLRFIWILIGICYFFPGFWKLWNSGTAWVLGNNMRDHMYVDWMGFDSWLPVVRIDQYPWLCRLGGAAVIVFEMSFLFLIFHPKLRYFVVFQGLLFHNLTNLLMNINFYVLQICYTSLVSWAGVFRWFGKKLFRQEMVVLFDGSCSFCRRAIAFMRVFDVFGRIRYHDLFETQTKPLKELHRISHDELMADMHAFIGTKVFKGFAAYQEIAARIPLLWPLCPFLPLGFVQAIGNRIYRQTADHRACRLVPKRVACPVMATPSSKALVLAAVILITGNVIFGFMGKGSGWPFACYPTFSEIASDRFRTIECQVIYGDGTEKTVRIQSLKTFTGAYRIVGLMTKIFNIKDEQERNRKFLALWEVLSFSDPDLKRAQTARFYFLDNYTDPAKRHLNPINKKMAFEFNVNR